MSQSECITKKGVVMPLLGITGFLEVMVTSSSFDQAVSLKKIY